VRDEPICAGAVRFFIGHGEKNNIAVEFNLLALQHHHHHQLGHAFVFHILRTASPEPAVFDLAAEGRDFPVSRVAGNHVHMVQHDDGPLGLRCSMRQARPPIAASRRVFENAILNAFLLKNLLVESDGAHLMARRVGRIDAQVLLHPRQRQIGILLQPLFGNAGRSHRRHRLFRRNRRVGKGCFGPRLPHQTPAERDGRKKSDSPLPDSSPPDSCPPTRVSPTDCSQRVLPGLSIHAVFISGLPKLPSRKRSGLCFLPDRRYNVFGYQAFSSSTAEPGLASNLYYKRQAPAGFTAPEVEVFRPALRQHRLAWLPPLAFIFVLGDAIKITQHARFGVLEWSPQTLPQLGGSFL
jgi:hypothetical protein